MPPLVFPDPGYIWKISVLLVDVQPVADNELIVHDEAGVVRLDIRFAAGVTLPLISYGGSSLITTVMLFGFLFARYSFR